MTAIANATCAQEGTLGADKDSEVGAMSFVAFNRQGGWDDGGGVVAEGCEQ